MKYLNITLLTLFAIVFTACSSKSKNEPKFYYYTNQQPVYEFVPVTPLVSPNNVTIIKDE